MPDARPGIQRPKIAEKATYNLQVIELGRPRNSHHSLEPFDISRPPHSLTHPPARHVLATSPPLRPGRCPPARCCPPRRRPRPILCRRGYQRGQAPRVRLRRRWHLCHCSGKKKKHYQPATLPEGGLAGVITGRKHLLRTQLASVMPPRSVSPPVGPMDRAVANKRFFFFASI